MPYPLLLSALAMIWAAGGGNFAAVVELVHRAASPAAATALATSPYTSSSPRPSRFVASVQIAYAASIASTS